MRTNYAWGIFFLELKEHKEKLIDNNTTIQPYKLINKEQSQLSSAESLLLMLQVNEGQHKWGPNQDIAKGLLEIGQ